MNFADPSHVHCVDMFRCLITLNPRQGDVGGRTLVARILKPSGKIQTDYTSTASDTKTSLVVVGMLRPLTDDEIAVITFETAKVQG